MEGLESTLIQGAMYHRFSERVQDHSFLLDLIEFGLPMDWGFTATDDLH